MEAPCKELFHAFCPGRKAHISGIQNGCSFYAAVFLKIGCDLLFPDTDKAGLIFRQHLMCLLKHPSGSDQHLTGPKHLTGFHRQQGSSSRPHANKIYFSVCFRYSPIRRLKSHAFQKLAGLLKRHGLLFCILPFLLFRAFCLRSFHHYKGCSGCPGRPAFFCKASFFSGAFRHKVPAFHTLQHGFIQFF